MPTVAQTNLLRDPGFDGTPAGVWGLSADANGNLAQYAGENPGGRSSNTSLRLVGNGTADVWQTLRPFDTRPNTQYVMSLWVNPSLECSDSLEIKVGFEAKRGEVFDYSGLRYISVGGLKKGQWNLVRASYFARGDTSQLTAKIMVFGKDEKPGMMIAFDDVQVTTVAASSDMKKPSVELKVDPNGQFSDLNFGTGPSAVSLLDGTGFSGFEVTDVTTGKTATLATRARQSGKNWIVEGHSDELKLNLTATLFPENGRLRGHVKIDDLTKTDRAITARVLFRLQDKNWIWNTSLSESVQVQASGKYSLEGSFADHGQSAYPFVSLSTAEGVGLGLGWPMENPRFYKLRYEADPKGAGVLTIETDLGLAGETTKFPNSADFDFVLYAYDGTQKFRGALNGYYAIYPKAFQTIVKQQGLWTLWVSGVAAEYAQKAGVAYHQAEYDLLPDASSLVMNDRAGMLSFEYVEPWGFWHPVPKGFLQGAGRETGVIVQSYEYNIATKPLQEIVRADTNSMVEADRYPGATRSEVAKAIDNSAIWKNAAGEWLVTITGDNFVWGNGDRKGSDFAVIIANPDPDLPHPNRADIAWQRQVGFVNERAKAAGTNVGGVFLDSLVFSMGWQRFNFRRDHWKYADSPLSFTTLPDGKIVPAQAMALSNVKFLRRNWEFAHANNWPVLANSWHPLYPIVGAYIDIFGAGEYSDPKQILDQSIYAQFRALAYRKPVSVMDYVLHFENLPVNQESVDNVIEPRINRYLMYGVYPGTANGWHPEKLDRLRLVQSVFEKYVTICRAINLAGWNPNTEATADGGNLLIERWGEQPANGLYFTLWNNGSTPVKTKISIARKKLGVKTIARVRELLSAQDCIVKQNGDFTEVTVDVPPQRTVVLQCQ